MSDVVLQSAVPMHAHKCQACAAAGKEVVWIHPNTCRGNIAVHKCPACGKVEWKQDAVETGKLPNHAQQPQGVDLNAVLGYVLLAIGLALFGYGVFIYVKKKGGVTHLFNEGGEGK
jgi:hypothetical protein